MRSCARFLFVAAIFILGAGNAAAAEVWPTIDRDVLIAFETGATPDKFMAYAAEEIGLRGSGEIAQQHLTQGINVVGVLQFDMTNYQGTRAADIVFYTDFTNAAQNAFVTSLANIYVPFLGTYPRLTDVCGYGCSDHASWNNCGFPASLPFESKFNQDNPFIHTVNDDIAHSGGSARTSMPFVKLAAAYMAELAKGGFTAPAEGAGEHEAPGRKTDLKAARSGKEDVGR